MCAAISEVLIWSMAIFFGLVGFVSAGQALVGLFAMALGAMGAR